MGDGMKENTFRPTISAAVHPNSDRPVQRSDSVRRTELYVTQKMQKVLTPFVAGNDGAHIRQSRLQGQDRHLPMLHKVSISNATRNSHK